jgi:hypothetical protein
VMAMTIKHYWSSLLYLRKRFSTSR